MVPTAYAAAFPFLGPHPHPNTLSTNDMNGVTSAGPSVLFRGDLGRAFDCDRGLGDPGESHCSILLYEYCLLYTSPSPRDKRQSRMPSSA